MQYEDFLRRVQSAGQLASREEAERAVEATMAALGEVMQPGQTMPNWLLKMMPQALTGGMPGQAQATAVGGHSPQLGRGSSNPQLSGQRRVESGGESTEESGQ